MSNKIAKWINQSRHTKTMINPKSIQSDQHPYISVDVGVRDKSLILYEQSYGTNLVLDHATNSILDGTYLMGGGIGDKSKSVVHNSNNLWVETFDNDVFKDASTTADWDTTSQVCNIGTGEALITDYIYLDPVKNPTSISINAKVGSGQFTYYYSTDGGSAWFGDERGVITSLNTTGTGLKIKVQPSYPYLDTRLVMYHRYDTDSATQLDYSGLGNDGTPGGNATFTEDGKIGGAYEFDALNAEIAVSDATSIQNIFDSGGTISVWINPIDDGEQSVGRIIGKHNIGFTTGWIFYLLEDDVSSVKLGFHHGFDSTNGSWKTVSRDIPLNEWTHVAVAYDNSSTSNDPILYINGLPVTITETTTPSGTRGSDAGEDLYVGSDNGLGYKTFNGLIDEVSIWDMELKQSYITYIYNSGVGKQAPYTYGTITELRCSYNVN